MQAETLEGGGQTRGSRDHTRGTRPLRIHFDEYQGEKAPMRNGLKHDIHLYDGAAITDEDRAKFDAPKKHVY